MLGWLPEWYRLSGLVGDIPAVRRWPNFRIKRFALQGYLARERQRRMEWRQWERNLRVRHFGFVADHVFSMTPHSWVCRNCPFWRCHERGYGLKYRWEDEPERFRRINGTS
jgi:hypothetical protein